MPGPIDLLPWVKWLVQPQEPEVPEWFPTDPSIEASRYALAERGEFKPSAWERWISRIPIMLYFYVISLIVYSFHITLFPLFFPLH